MKRKGFTLVELLIVIIVIGILAGGMMLASASATDSARAATLVSDLRNAKAAGVVWFADNLNIEDSLLPAAWIAGTTATDFETYMDNVEKAKQLVFLAPTVSGVQCYFVGKANADARVGAKVVSLAAGTVFDAAGAPAVAGTNPIYMRVK